MLELLGHAQPENGWGRSQTIEIGNECLFVKRIPVTNKEYANPFSTENLYALPPHFNFGLGSLGLGVFRELAAALKTNEWVLSGENGRFPLLYHHRLVPFLGQHQTIDPGEQAQYVSSWGGSENIGRYLHDRATAKYELLLFFEHIPYTLRPWLQENLDQVAWVLDELLAIIDFFQQKEILHFDTHLDNILTDGKTIYLADFGLVLDRSFALRPDEKLFFDQHNHYDYGQAISNLFIPIYDIYQALSATKQQQVRAEIGLQKGQESFYPLITALFEQIERLEESRLVTVPQIYSDSVVKYRAIIRLMIAFYQAMRQNPQKDAPFPNAALQGLLQNLETTS